MAKKETIKIDDVDHRLSSKWQDVWGNWQFWWQSYDSDAEEWVNIANGDLDWAGRMSAHYNVKITGAYPESQKNEPRQQN